MTGLIEGFWGNGRTAKKAALQPLGIDGKVLQDLF